MNPFEGLVKGMAGIGGAILNAFQSNQGGHRVASIAETHTKAAFETLKTSHPKLQTVNIFVINNNGSGPMTIHIPPIDPGNTAPPLASVTNSLLEIQDNQPFYYIMTLSVLYYGLSSYVESLSFSSLTFEDLSYDLECELFIWNCL